MFEPDETDEEVGIDAVAILIVVVVLMINCSIILAVISAILHKGG